MIKSGECPSSPATTREMLYVHSPALLRRRQIDCGRQAEQMLTVIAQFSNRIVNVLQREMAALLGVAVVDVGRPASRQFLHRAHVEVAVVKIPLELRHAARE